MDSFFPRMYHSFPNLFSDPEDFLMEKRIGIIAIIVQTNTSVPHLNMLLSEYSTIIHARLGLPFRDKGIGLISLVVEGNTDEIGALTGKLGRLAGIKVKSVLTKFREDAHDSENGKLSDIHYS